MLTIRFNICSLQASSPRNQIVHASLFKVDSLPRSLRWPQYMVLRVWSVSPVD